LLAFKAERRLDLYAGEPCRLVRSWPILAASGEAGPKIREGDGQVPEGFYRITFLNPNSRYHLSLRVGYPNPTDLAQAAEEGRDPSSLGGDIMIHGGAGSVGCLAIGDEAIEELFVLAARTGADRIRLISAPCDFRTGAGVEVPASAPSWTAELHERLREGLRAFPPR
jgi:murein L,D-transpeptidase YafK